MSSEARIPGIPSFPVPATGGCVSFLGSPLAIFLYEISLWQKSTRLLTGTFVRVPVTRPCPDCPLRGRQIGLGKGLGLQAESVPMREQRSGHAASLPTGS